MLVAMNIQFSGMCEMNVIYESIIKNKGVSK